MLRRRPLTARRAAVIIAVFTVSVTVIGAAVAWLVDRHDFHSFGLAFWWALQTVTSVGYGDVVPTTTVGRVIAGVLMVSGLAFLAVVTASVTAALIESTRGRLGRRRRAPTDDIATRLASIDTRLEKIESALRPQRD